MAVWVKNEENASENRQSKKEAEEADKVEVGPGVTAGNLRPFVAALVGPIQGLPGRRRLRRPESLKTLRTQCCRRCYY